MAENNKARNKDIQINQYKKVGKRHEVDKWITDDMLVLNPISLLLVQTC